MELINLQLTNHFTPDELCAHFKEHLLFTTHVAEEIVHEIRRFTKRIHNLISILWECQNIAI
jgi:hypothetical protein